MNLPYSSGLDVSKLAAVFNNTSATYKYYWLLSIIEACEEGSTEILKRELFARMISNAWYTVNYFHVSFGTQDLIQSAIKVIAETEMIPINIRKEPLFKTLLNSENITTQNLLRHFDKNVPHWFLTPWIFRDRGENDSAYRNTIYDQSRDFANQALYALYPDRIEINPAWTFYLRDNGRILKDYCYWNLSLFLQVRNPNVPNIPGKLIKPPIRASLVKQRKNYWDIVFKELGTIGCIYTDTALHINNYALDHFVPHAFVSHDLIWNLAPIDITFNSIKSDRLPDMDFHFDKFYKVQKKAFDIVAQINPQSKLLEEYIYLFGANHHENKFGYEIFRNAISPLISIAENNGFQKFIV